MSEKYVFVTCTHTPQYYSATFITPTCPGRLTHPHCPPGPTPRAPRCRRSVRTCPCTLFPCVDVDVDVAAAAHPRKATTGRHRARPVNGAWPVINGLGSNQGGIQATPAPSLTRPPRPASPPGAGRGIRYDAAASRSTLRFLLNPEAQAGASPGSLLSMLVFSSDGHGCGF